LGDNRGIRPVKSAPETIPKKSFLETSKFAIAMTGKLAEKQKKRK